jgi:hypothetical protein
MGNFIEYSDRRPSDVHTAPEFAAEKLDCEGLGDRFMRQPSSAACNKALVVASIADSSEKLD